MAKQTTFVVEQCVAVDGPGVAGWMEAQGGFDTVSAAKKWILENGEEGEDSTYRIITIREDDLRIEPTGKPKMRFVKQGE